MHVNAVKLRNSALLLHDPQVSAALEHARNRTNKEIVEHK